jgi:iron complex transport system substrate-binding protein
LAEVLGDIPRLAATANVPEAGERLVRALRARLAAVADAVGEAADRPRVIALEWLDPPYVGGHWVPEMIELAGGVDALGVPGSKSRVATWDELRECRPEVAVVMPCGLYADEAREQALVHREELASLGVERAWAVDAASSFSRPGPRLIDGIELLGHLLHPDCFPAPPEIAWHALSAELRAPAVGAKNHRMDG